MYAVRIAETPREHADSTGFIVHCKKLAGHRCHDEPTWLCIQAIDGVQECALGPNLRSVGSNRVDTRILRVRDQHAPIRRERQVIQEKRAGS